MAVLESSRLVVRECDAALESEAASEFSGVRCVCGHEAEAHQAGMLDCLATSGPALNGKPVWCGCRAFEPVGAQSATPAGSRPIEEKDGQRGSKLSSEIRDA